MADNDDSLLCSSSHSSLAPSTPATSGAGPHATAPVKHHQRRRSLVVLGRLPRELSSMLRSHSTRSSRRQSPLHEARQPPRARMPQADDARPASPYAPVQPLDMHRDREKSADRESKGRLYNFLHRSRSRSRTKGDRVPSADATPVPELPSHARNPDQLVAPLPGAKPPSRIQSRPLSSTTTATNTTITPRTPTQTRRPTKHPPDPAGASSSRPSSRPTTPKPSAARKKLHNLFGIPLASPRKNPPHSPPGSPQTSHDHDFPHAHHDLYGASLYRSESPSPMPARTKEKSASPPPSRMDFFRTQKLFSGTGSRPPTTTSRPSTSSRPSTGGATPPTPPSHVYATTNMTTGHDHDPSRPHAALSEIARPLHRTILSPQPRAAATVPQITHTPPTPSRSATSPPQLGPRSDSIDSKRGYHPMAVVDEECATLATDKGKARARANVGTPMAREVSSGGHSRAKSATAAPVPVHKGRTHGSFDFERPGWASSRGAVNPSGESLPSRRRTTERDRERDREREREAARLEPEHTGASAGSSNAHSHSTAHTRSTSASAGAGLTSSLGRASGRRARGPGQIKVGGGIAHGPFAFEKAVPSPTTSDASRGREREEEAQRGRERERERERARARERGAVPVPVPVPAGQGSAGYRSGTKGRSLDLGLGLAWAPSKVREDALLPSKFGRSLSASSKKDERAGDGAGRSKVGREVAEVFRSALDDEGYAAFKKYVHRFDAHDIPFDGPTGIVARVERLLAHAPALGDNGKRELLDNFVRIILQNA